MATARAMKYEISSRPSAQRMPRISEEERGRRVAQRAANAQKRPEAYRVQRREAVLEKKTATRSFANRLAAVGFVFLCFAMLAFSVAGYVMVISTRQELNGMKSDLSEIKSEIVDLKVEAAEATDIQVVQDKAETRLDMGYPATYQVVQVQNPDRTTTASTELSSVNAKDVLNSLGD